MGGRTARHIHSWALVILVACLFAIIGCTPEGQDRNEFSDLACRGEDCYVRGEVLVIFDSNVSKTDARLITEQLGVKIDDYIGGWVNSTLRMALVSVPSGKEFVCAEKLRLSPLVRAADLNKAKGLAFGGSPPPGAHLRGALDRLRRTVNPTAACQ